MNNPLDKYIQYIPEAEREEFMSYLKELVELAQDLRQASFPAIFENWPEWKEKQKDPQFRYRYGNREIRAKDEL